MKRMLASFLCVLTLLACALPAQAASFVYVRQTENYWAEPYYHKNKACHFGAELYSGEYDIKLIKCSVATAEKNFCRPCPICAYSFKPMFTGTFPKWNYKTPPYYLSGEKHYLSSATLVKFGDTVAKIDTWCQTRSPSKYYAGVYKNDSGTCTLLMTNPTAAKASDWKKRLGSDFWVIEAKYSQKQLNNLNTYAIKLIGKYGINSVGIDDAANRVSIGTSDNSKANMKKIYAVLKAKGYPLDAVWIYKSEPGSADF